jgi:predicted site-specific integrase-resolvase
MVIAPETLSAKEAAAYLGKTYDTLIQWRKRKVGPPYIREVGRVIYLKSDIDQWREQNRCA